MIELAKHIEVLLLENDCVIVPQLGGFIAHYRPAYINKADGKMYPPSRTIGFNPRLVMNDGLLVQSYMQAYNTDFPDATRKIEKAVSQIKDNLYHDGQVNLNHVGMLYYNIHADYEFEPSANGFFTPMQYGMKPLVLPAVNQSGRHSATAEPAEKSFRNRRHHLMQYAATVAASILLFFLLSVPVENTYVDDAAYASLGSAEMFMPHTPSVSQRSTSTLPGRQNQSQTPKHADKVKQHKIKNNVNTLKPVKVKTEKVMQAAAPSPVRKATPHPSKSDQTTASPINLQKGYYIIVASLPTAQSAEQELRKLKQNGYGQAQVISAQGRYRIAISHFSTQNQAYQEIQNIKKNKNFSSAWVFTSK